MNIRSCTILFVVITNFNAVSISDVKSQSISGTFYKTQVLDGDSLLSLLRDCTSAKLPFLPNELYGSAHDKNLADAIFFFDANESKSKVAIFKRDKTQQELFGEPYIYCLIFLQDHKREYANLFDQESEHQLAFYSMEDFSDINDSLFLTIIKNDTSISESKHITRIWETKDTTLREHKKLEIRASTDVVQNILDTTINKDKKKDTSIVFRQAEKKRDTTVTIELSKEAPWIANISFTQVGYSPSGGDVSLLNGFLKVVEKLVTAPPVPEKDTSPSRDTSFNVKMGVWGPTAKDSLLLWSYFKFPLAKNTVNRFTVRLKNGLYGANATFGNYNSARLGISLGIIGTILGDEITKTQKVESFWIKPFLLGHIYIKRPNVPEPHFNNPGQRLLHRMSLSLTIGPKLSKDNFLEDFFIGITTGHLIGPMGFTFGKTRRDKKMDYSLGFQIML